MIELCLICFNYSDWSMGGEKHSVVDNAFFPGIIMDDTVIVILDYVTCAVRGGRNSGLAFAATDDVDVHRVYGHAVHTPFVVTGQGERMNPYSVNYY